MIATVLCTSFARQGAAQGIAEKMTNAARRFAAVATEAAMSNPTVLNLESRGLPTIDIGGLTVGVSRVDVKDAVGVRVQVFYFNPTEQAISVPLPNDQTFVLVDSRGKRLQFLWLKLADVPSGAAVLTVPALERATATVLYLLTADDAPDAILKVGTAGIIRGIPIGVATTPTAVALPPTPPKDSAASPKDTTGRPKPPVER